jgi:hypothetical protein
MTILSLQKVKAPGWRLGLKTGVINRLCLGANQWQQVRKRA